MIYTVSPHPVSIGCFIVNDLFISWLFLVAWCVCLAVFIIDDYVYLFFDCWLFLAYIDDPLCGGEMWVSYGSLVVLGSTKPHVVWVKLVNPQQGPTPLTKIKILKTIRNTLNGKTRSLWLIWIRPRIRFHSFIHISSACRQSDVDNSSSGWINVVNVATRVQNNHIQPK